MDALDAQCLEEFGGVQFLLRAPIEAGLETGLLKLLRSLLLHQVDEVGELVTRELHAEEAQRMCGLPENLSEELSGSRIGQIALYTVSKSEFRNLRCQS